MPRGALIVLEGIDNSGKSTQAHALVKSLDQINVPVNYMRFPDRAVLSGAVLESYAHSADDDVDSHTTHLLYAANRWENMKELEHLLMLGHTVIIDRYSYSGTAYSLARDPDLTYEWCWACEKGLLEPDKIFYFNIDVDTSIKRGEAAFLLGEKEMERWEKDEFFLKTVKAIYEEMLIEKGTIWKEIDASLSREKITTSLMVDILKTIDEVQNQPLHHI